MSAESAGGGRGTSKRATACLRLGRAPARSSPHEAPAAALPPGRAPKGDGAVERALFGETVRLAGGLAGGGLAGQPRALRAARPGAPAVSATVAATQPSAAAAARSEHAESANGLAASLAAKPDPASASVRVAACGGVRPREVRPPGSRGYGPGGRGWQPASSLTAFLYSEMAARSAAGSASGRGEVSAEAPPESAGSGRREGCPADCARAGRCRRDRKYSTVA